MMRKMKLWNRVKKNCGRAVVLTALAGALTLSDMGTGFNMMNHCDTVRADAPTDTPSATPTSTVTPATATPAASGTGATATPAASGTGTTATPTASGTGATATPAASGNENVLSAVPALMAGAAPLNASTPTATASTTTADSAKTKLENYNSNLQQIYRFSDDNVAKLNKICNDAKSYIDQNTTMIAEELDAYVAEIEGQMDTFAAKNALADATPTPDDTEKYGSSTTTASAKTKLDNYNSNLQQMYDFTVENRNKLNKICNDAKAYIESHKEMTPTELDSYVAEIKGQMEAFASKYGMQEMPLTSTSEYIGLYNNLAVQEVEYGQTCMIVIPVVNYCKENLNNIIVKPQMSADKNVWPFEIEQTGYNQVIPYLPGNETRDTVYDNRMEIGWTFDVRNDVVSGYYELKFDVTYERNGATETAVLSTFVKVNGSPEADKKEEDENARASTPRIIVTGFETNPAQVFAGDTFTLTLHIQNTSNKTAVSNILFDLQAAVSGGDNTNAVAGVAPFLPTSGSSTIFEDYIAPGASVDISIEMTARADLSQKPYVLNVKMDYEDEKANPYTQEANVSIPIYQEAKYEIGSMEISPNSIATYEESNIMFSIYNTGKTTLYNVQVKFEQDYVSGGDVFLGKLDPGATGNVDTMVTGQMPNEGYITAHISYEDESGNVTTVDKEIELYIYEMTYDDSMDVWPEEDPMMPEDGGKSGKKTIYIVLGCVAAGVVAAGAVTGVVLKKRKKKKMLLELENETDNEIL